MTMKQHPLMGTRVKDLITGIEGLVTAYTQYITGCDQLLLTTDKDPEKPNVYPESQWLDDNRLERVGRSKLNLDVSGSVKTKGFGPPAPIK